MVFTWKQWCMSRIPLYSFAVNDDANGKLKQNNYSKKLDDEEQRTHAPKS